MRKKKKSVNIKIGESFNVNKIRKILSAEKKYYARNKSGVNDHYTGLERREFKYQKFLGRGLSFWQNVTWVYYDRDIGKYGLW